MFPLSKLWLHWGGMARSWAGHWAGQLISPNHVGVNWVIFSFCYSYVLIDGTSPNDLSKQKIIHVTDKLLQANMVASSGLRENVYPIIFFVKMFIYIKLLYYYNNWHRWWSQCLMLFFFLFQVQVLLPDVYFILFYFIFIMFVFLVLCLHRCYMQIMFNH